MAENNWGPDVAPPLQEFAAAATATTWTLQDSVVADQTFASAAVPSTDVYWGGLASMQFDAEAGGVNGTATPAGVSVTAAVGTATATGGALVTALGVESTSSIGAATAGGDALAQPDGVVATASVGTPTATGDALASTAGVEMVAAVGTAVASSQADATASPAGVEASSSLGTVLAHGDALADTLGVASVSAVGIATASGDPVNGTASPLGVGMVASVGTASAFDADQVVSSGGVGWRSGKQTRDEGKPIVSVTVFTFGVSAQARVGRATASGSAAVSVDGVATIAAVGTAQAGADGVTDGAGVSTGALVGKAAAWDVHVLPVLPYTPVPARPVQGGGNHTAALSVSIATDDTVGHLPPDAIDRAWHDLQTEDDELLLLGVIA